MSLGRGARALVPRNSLCAGQPPPIATVCHGPPCFFILPSGPASSQRNVSLTSRRVVPEACFLRRELNKRLYDGDSTGRCAFYFHGVFVQLGAIGLGNVYLVPSSLFPFRSRFFGPPGFVSPPVLRYSIPSDCQPLDSRLVVHMVV